MMKAIITIEFTLDGEMGMEQIKNAFYTILPGVITSETIENSEEWAILIDSVGILIADKKEIK